MLFNSGVFLVFFLPITLIGYRLLAGLGRRSILAWLAFASVVFYSYWNWHFAFVLVGSMLMNFTVSRLIASVQSPGRKKFWMIAGIVLNLTALFYYKYLFHLLRWVESITHGTHVWGDVALPLGISFFTFTQIAYLIDLAQEEAEPQSIVEYALFVTFFPHLIAGPILHHREMMPQFLAKTYGRMNMDDMLVGMTWFVLGFAKKCIVADTIGVRADQAFALGSTLGIQAAWCGVISYSLQLYFDFSGYSDMAIGLARMFSIRFPMNFNSPYKAGNIIDFWQRWHMTLTRYLTLYLYNPISLAVSRGRLKAGKKVSQKAARTIPGFLSMIAWPTLVTMVIVGVWHGAGLQFMIFGLLHGVYLTVNHGWRLYQGQVAERKPAGAVTKVASVLGTYMCVLIAQVFFRASSTVAAIQYLSGMFGLHGSNWHDPAIKPSRVLLAVLGLLLVWFPPNTQQILGQADASIPAGRWSWMTWRPSLKWSVAIGLLFFVSMLYIQNTATFLYFQF
jgi:D-alanyl-lipoteichoic acid acyltransferase DltB (MBOAT superfamily)